MRRTQDQKRFTISEVAADWRKRQWRSQDLVVVGALEEWGMGIGVPSPRGRGLGRGLCPFLRKFLDFFGVRMTCFGAFLHYFE